MVGHETVMGTVCGTVGCEEHLWAQVCHCQACKLPVVKNSLLELSGHSTKDGLRWALDGTRCCATHFTYSSRSS